MIFSRLFKAVITVITLFAFTGMIGNSYQAQAKQSSPQKEKLRKYNSKNKYNSKKARLKRLKRRRLARYRAQRRVQNEKRRVRNEKRRLAKIKKSRYRLSANRKRRGVRHSIFKQSYKPGTIIVSFGDKKLYYFSAKKRVIVYPIGTPRKGFEWKGKTHVSWKTKNPRWTPTKRMREENPKLPEFVEGGTKANPLGVRALYLGKSEYRIHGTNAPWSIGKARSSGCIRMHNSHVIDLYQRVKPKAPVIITWTKYAKKSSRVAHKKKSRRRNKKLRSAKTTRKNKKTARKKRYSKRRNKKRG